MCLPAQQLLLTGELMTSFKSQIVLRPPLRTEELGEYTAHIHYHAQHTCSTTVQSLAQYLSHLHELLKGFKLEKFAFCDQLLRITLLQKTEKTTVHPGSVEDIQTDHPETHHVHRKGTDSCYYLEENSFQLVPTSNSLTSITFNGPDLC